MNASKTLRLAAVVIAYALLSGMAVPPQAAADTSSKFSKPNLLDETVYRPNSPLDDTHGGRHPHAICDGCRT